MKKLLLTLFFIPALCLSSHAQTLPTADEVINKYIAAIGGKKALMNVKDVICQGSFQIANSAPSPITLKSKLPAKILTEITGDKGQLVYKSVIDETNVVETTPQGTTRQTGLNARVSMMFNRFFTEQTYKQEGIKSTVIGIEPVDGRNAYKVTCTFADGTPLCTNYYDVATGLKVKSMTTWPGGRTGTSRFMDYKDVNGVKLPFNETFQENGGVIIQILTNSVQINKGISDTEFNVQ